MSVNFMLGKCQNQISDKVFGLRDLEDKRPAFIDTTRANRKLWIAAVLNKQRYNVNFVPVDHCIPFPRVDGKKVKRCDCALFHNSTITFVELKQRTVQRKWLADGEKQLRNAIERFKVSEWAAAYPIKKAYIANRLQPRFNKAHTRRSELFYDETGYVLRIQNSIVLE